MGKKMKRVYVDMDDTLCDFMGQFYIDVKKNPKIHKKCVYA